MQTALRKRKEAASQGGLRLALQSDLGVVVVKLWKSLQNPFLLVGQGFVLGAILFYATNP